MCRYYEYVLKISEETKWLKVLHSIEILWKELFNGFGGQMCIAGI